MKKFIFIVSSLILNNMLAQQVPVPTERKQLFLRFSVTEATWTKSLFQEKYAYKVFPTNEGRKLLWDEVQRILNENALPVDYPYLDYSNVYDGFDLTDAVTVLEAMDRAGMDLNLVYLLPEHFVFVRLGEENNYIQIEKMTLRERIYFQYNQEEGEPVVFYSL